MTFMTVSCYNRRLEHHLLSRRLLNCLPDPVRSRCQIQNPLHLFKCSGYGFNVNRRHENVDETKYRTGDLFEAYVLILCLVAKIRSRFH